MLNIFYFIFIIMLSPFIFFTIAIITISKIKLIYRSPIIFGLATSGFMALYLIPMTMGIGELHTPYTFFGIILNIPTFILTWFLVPDTPDNVDTWTFTFFISSAIAWFFYGWLIKTLSNQYSKNTTDNK